MVLGVAGAPEETQNYLLCRKNKLNEIKLSWILGVRLDIRLNLVRLNLSF